MITFRRLTTLLFVSIGFGFNSIALSASDPSIYSNILTSSPLGDDRVLVLCLLKKSDNEILSQFYDRVNWDGFSERHLTIVEVTEHVVQSVFVDNPGNAKGVIKRARRQDFGDQLRRKANCKTELEFVLIGKDMGVKKRWERSVPSDELFNIIDAMPMRRYEMRQKAEKN